LAKIAAVLPPDLRRELDESALLVSTASKTPEHLVAPDLLRMAIRTERKLQIAYKDISGAISQRVVWPFALVYFDQSRVLMCWCELRNDFRNFRSDRITEAELLETRYPKHRQALLREWRRIERERANDRRILPETDTGY
jgi:predicted DNA-binding transcriptional regulator YafY